MTFHNLTHVIERLQFKTQLLFINCNEKTLLHFFCFVIKLPIKTECYWLQELFLLSRFCNFLALFKSYMKNNSRETLTLTLPLLEAVSKTYLILFIHKKRKKKRKKESKRLTLVEFSHFSWETAVIGMKIDGMLKLFWVFSKHKNKLNERLM